MGTAAGLLLVCLGFVLVDARVLVPKLFISRARAPVGVGPRSAKFASCSHSVRQFRSFRPLGLMPLRCVGSASLAWQPPLLRRDR